jgi:hypothetical protein
LNADKLKFSTYMIFLYYLIPIRVHFILKPSENKELKRVSHQSANPLTKKNIFLYYLITKIFEELTYGLGLHKLVLAMKKADAIPGPLYTTQPLSRVHVA